jgi:hypothetical protein
VSATEPQPVQGRGTGWTVWDGAVVLAHYLDAATRQKELPPFLAGVTSCVELGSGTGMAGIAAAACLQVCTTLYTASGMRAVMCCNLNYVVHDGCAMTLGHSHGIPEPAGHARRGQCGSACVHEKQVLVPFHSSRASNLQLKLQE